MIFRSCRYLLYINNYITRAQQCADVDFFVRAGSYFVLKTISPERSIANVCIIRVCDIY